MGGTAKHLGGRRVSARSVVVLACAVLLAAGGGCARGGGRSDVGLGAGASVHESADVGALGVSCAGPGYVPPVAGHGASEPTPQPLPADFVPVRAERCEFSSVTVPGDGEWQVRDQQRADSGLDALAAALRQPSQNNATGSCTLEGMVPVVITLTDAHGRELVPVLPHQACGRPLQAVAEAIQGLPWRSVNRKKVQRTRTQLEIDSGCPGMYKPMIAIKAEEDPIPSSEQASSGPGQAPTALEVCRYRLDPAETISGTDPSVRFKAGVLSSAATLSGAAVTRFLGAVGAAGPVTARCEQPQAPFATVSGKGGTGPYLVVELGGCYRVDDGNGALRQVDRGTVALLTA